MCSSPRRPDSLGIAIRRRRSTRVALVALAATLQVMLHGPTAFGHEFRQWSRAVSVDPTRQNGVNTSVNDGCPVEAPDGHMLFLASNRVPGAAGTKDLDIWVAYRESEDLPWGDAEPLPAPINTAAAEFCPTPLPGNQLLFVSTQDQHVRHRQRPRHLLHAAADVATRMDGAGPAVVRARRWYQQRVRGVLAVARAGAGANAAVLLEQP